MPPGASNLDFARIHRTVNAKCEPTRLISADGRLQRNADFDGRPTYVNQSDELLRAGSRCELTYLVYTSRTP